MIERVQQRQDAKIVSPNGAIYIAMSENLRSGKSWWDNPIGFMMPQERSVDIDTPMDLRIAEVLLTQQGYAVGAEDAWRMAI